MKNIKKAVKVRKVLSAASIMLSVVVLLISCGMLAPEDNGVLNKTGIIRSKGAAAPVSMTSYTKSDYTVFIRKEGYAPGRLEPDNGCYLGSYVLANSSIEYDAEKFDRLTGRQHALSVYNMKLGEEFPYEWVLGCASAKKTPYIIVRPPNDYSVFQEDRLIPAAKSFGEISIPVFMDFYPNPQSYTGNHEAYAVFYRKAWRAFKEYAPNVIFVLSADSKNVYDLNLYYPGDEYVDWVGISMYQTLYVNGIINLRNYMKDLDYLYQTYQWEKPLLISQLAISNFSTADHRYASKEAAQKLTDFYSKIMNEYPRVKAVNYIDFDNVPGAPKNAERDNFSVTQDETVLSAYRTAVSDGWFLSETAEEKGTGAELFKCAFAALEDENFKYIPQYAFSMGGLSITDKEGIIINGEVYYSTEKLLKSNEIKCVIDDKNRRIILEQNRR